MSKGTFERKKASTSNFSPASLVSPHTPTLANPVRGFGLATNNVIQAQTLESTNQETAQPAEESLLSQAIGQRSFSHDISRIALRRPQAKLTVGKPGDKYEQEADEMANQVMRMVVPDKFNTPSVQPGQNSLQRKCAACEEEEDKVQTKPSIQPSTDGGLQSGENLESRLNSSKGGGSPLADEVRSFMEPRFGADFSSVRVHTNSDALQMNQELGAQAFTHGSDVYFGAGKSPGNNELTAHELTHVVQQKGLVQAQNGNPALPESSSVSTSSNKTLMTKPIAFGLQIKSVATEHIQADSTLEPSAEKSKLVARQNELDSKIIETQAEYEAAVTKKDESLQKLKDIKRELTRLKREDYLVVLYHSKDITEPAETIITRCQKTSANEVETIQLIHTLSGGGGDIRSTLQNFVVKSPELFPEYVMGLYSSVIAEFRRQSQEEKKNADTLLKPHLNQPIDQIEDEYLAMIKDEKRLQNLSIDINYLTVLDQNSPLILDKKNPNSTDIGINNIKVEINQLKQKASGQNPLIGGDPEVGLGFLYDILVAYYFYDLYKEMAEIMDSYRQATQKTYQSLGNPDVESDLKDLYAIIGSREIIASVIGGGNKSGGYDWVSKQFENKLDPWVASQSMPGRVWEGIKIYYHTHDIKSEVWEGVKAAFTPEALLTLLGFIALILVLNAIPFGGPIAAQLLEDYFLADMIASFEPFLRYAWTAADASTFRGLYSSTSILEGMIAQVTTLVVQWVGLKAGGKAIGKFAKYGTRNFNLKSIEEIRNDPAIKEGSPKIQEAFKKGEVSNKEFSKWEKTLDEHSQAEFQQNPELKKTWAEMDPDARRLLTRCASPCIPKGATPEHGTQIKSMLQRLDVSADLEGLLKEYFYKNRGNLDAAIEKTNGAKTIEDLESTIKPELDPKNVAKYEAIKARRLAEIEAKRKVYEESQKRVKDLDEKITQAESEREESKKELADERIKNNNKLPLNEVERALVDQINELTKEIGKLNQEKLREIRAGQGITPELYAQLRKKTPSGKVRSQVISRSHGVDEVFGENDKTQGKPLEADHIVSMKEITQMEGFNRLTFEQQVEVLNNPDNFIAMNENANGSKQDMSWSEWNGWKEFVNDPNDLSVKNKMLNKEAKARGLLQGHIQQLLAKNK